MVSMSTFGEKRDQQNYFFLSCIQISAIGIAPIAIGNFLSIRYEPGTAICSILVGNLILWIIGISIISISNQNNSIQTIKGYIGNPGAFIISAIFIISVLDWFAFGINSSVNSLHEFIQVNDNLPENIFLRIGTALGLFTALLSLGGIRLLKWASATTFPFLVVYFLYQLLNSDRSIPTITWGLSLSAIIMTIFSLLAGVVNLPTFFRHSKSRADSYLALSFFTLFYMFFECSAIWINFKDASSGILMNNVGNSWLQNQSVIVFIILTCICNNLMNIYFASACYETFSPRFYGMKGHAIMGLMGTATYAFIQISPPIAFLLELINAYILNLAIVLLIAFLLRLMVKHSSSSLEKGINCAAWIVGCIAGTISKLQNPEKEFDFLFVGVSVSILFFLTVIFMEETIRAIRDLRIQKVEK